MVKIDRFFITADRYNVILQEEKIKATGKKAGEKYMENIGFYHDLEGAVLGAYKILSRESIAKSETKNVKEQIKELQEIKENLKKEMEKIKWEK